MKARAAWLFACCAALMAGSAQAQQITQAEYAAPTTRYAHGVLGDAVEWGALHLTLDSGRRITITLPESLVFEDTAPRLADLDGDGAPEVIVVESSLTQGARLAVYGPAGRIAATPHIGQRNRWLAPIGAADLDGDGFVEIAYIDRPHLGAMTLRIWRFADGQMTQVAERPGLTNHKIGWDFIPGGIRDCGDGPEIITALHNWMMVTATRFRDGSLHTYGVSVLRTPQDLDTALTCK